MELITYREIYHEPVTMIPVPKNLQNQAFEVNFVAIENPVIELENTQAIHNNLAKKNTGLGKLMRSYFEDIPPAQNEAEKLVMPIRDIEPAVEFK